MEIQRFGIKIYLEEDQGFYPEDLVPVFHGWIQNDLIPHHLVIDVTDYSHIPYGPGVILIAHEGNYSLGNSDRRWGLLYTRKQPLEGTFEERFKTVLKAVLYAAHLLENSGAKLKFKVDEWRFIANDRLQASNQAETFTVLQRQLNLFLPLVLGAAPVIRPVATRPGERLAAQISLSQPLAMDVLLQRLSLTAESVS